MHYLSLAAFGFSPGFAVSLAMLCFSTLPAAFHGYVDQHNQYVHSCRSVVVLTDRPDLDLP
jgi:hypothetical protein